MAAARFAFVPLLAGTAWAVSESADAYKRIYVVTKYVAHRRGARFDQYPQDDVLATAIPPLVGLATGAAVFVGAKALIDRILLSRRPNKNRLFDTLTQMERPRLTMLSAVRMLGPSASPSSLRAFRQLHGLQVTSVVLSLLWAVLIAPVAHARVECLWAPHGDPLTRVSKNPSPSPGGRA